MLGVCGAHAMAADALINVQSQSRFDSKDTLARLEAQVSARSMAVFARVDHQAAAMQKAAASD